MAPQPVSLLSLTTALPPHRINQSTVIKLARRIYGRAIARYPKLADVFISAGIDQRYSVQSLDWFLEPRGWPERTKAYLEVQVSTATDVEERGSNRVELHYAVA